MYVYIYIYIYIYIYTHLARRLAVDPAPDTALRGGTALRVLLCACFTACQCSSLVH